MDFIKELDYWKYNNLLRPDTMDRINDLFPDTEEGQAARDYCMEIIVSIILFQNTKVMRFQSLMLLKIKLTRNIWSF